MGLTTPFAQNGDKKAIPQNTSDGSVSFNNGFGSFYALPPEEGGLFIDRAQFNQLMYDTTSQVLENKTAIATQANRINEVNTNLTQSINTKANQATTYTKTEVNNLLNAKANQANTYTKTETYNKNEVEHLLSAVSKTTYTKREIDDRVNTKANWNAVVDLTNPQTINGAKTFTSNITAPNITNLQNQMNGLISSGAYPLLTKNTSLDITVGSGGMFSNLIDGLIFLKQNISKNPNVIGKITLLSSFNDDLYLKGYPFKIFIDCNGFTLANNLFLEKCSITFNSLTLNGQLNCLITTAHIVNGAVINGNSQLPEFFGSSIVANSNSFVSISGNVTLRPPATQAGIYSKASRVYLVHPSSWVQNQGQYFGYVIAGGIICADGGVNLQQVKVRKTNVAANTLTSSGIIFGNMWG